MIRLARGTLALGAVVSLACAVDAQAQCSYTSGTPCETIHSGTQNGNWRYWGGDAASSRYSPLEQINAENFSKLEVAWVWRGDNFGPEVDPLLRATPIYAEGKLFSVAGSTRTVVSIDPATGETLWMWRMPTGQRWKDSMRKNYGKGVAYDVVDGKGRVYIVTPSFHLAALDAQTGRPVQEFGKDGIVDLLADLGYPFDPEKGIDPKIGYITNSSPPIIVNGVIVVGNSHEQGYYQTRKENVPGHILAYDSKTGKHLWKFNVIPQPGEFGHETWENDSWKYTGNLSTWAPISADPQRNLVFLPTDPGTNDYYGGHRLGNNLFGTSLVALDAKTGKRVWHFQMVHHDVWNYDTPHAPQLADVMVNGKKVPVVVQTTKQSWAYVFNRETGEPVWPIEEKPVPQSDVPGERLSPTQPFPTKPAAYEQQGISENDLIDYTPALRQEALALMKQYRMGPMFNPPSRRGAPDGTKASIHCPGANGGTNIPGGSNIDPETGILYVVSTRACSAPELFPGKESGDPNANMDWVTNGPGGVRGPQGLPLLKPPYGRITAIDLKTGEHLWWIPNGDTPEAIKKHKALQGVQLPVTGKPTHATTLVTKTLLMYGEGRGGSPLFHAVDKRTGKEVAAVQIPAPTMTAPMTFMHEGKQFVLMAIGGGTQPGSLVALRLPD